mmetsp:Transcript_25313/g.100894  ORF Transcript_25313/g.100894 Transcript_25313/m.100894 type:complete len:219 (-) Transcript_25313:286-942(-)
MVGLARGVDVVAPWLRLSETVAQFSATLAAQTRLDVEAAHLRRFNANFRGWRDVSFPVPLFATDEVLVETFEHGKLVASLAEKHGPVSRRVGAYLVNRGEDVYLKMLLDDKLMHADLHPGNLLYDDRHSDNVVLVDAGMVARLDERETEAFIGLVEALGAADAPAAARCVRLFSPANAAMPPAAVAAFDADMVALFRERCRGYGTGVDFGDVGRAPKP